MRSRALVDTLAPGVKARDTAERETPARLATSAAVTNVRRTVSWPTSNPRRCTHGSFILRPRCTRVQDPPVIRPSLPPCTPPPHAARAEQRRVELRSSRAVPTSTTVSPDPHESLQHPRDHRQHAAHPRQPPVRPGRQRLDQVRTREPRRLDQGPHRAVDGRGRRGDGQAQAGRHDHRAHVGQHRHRPRDGRRGEGLQAGAGDAGQHVDRAPAIDARVRRDVRADTRGRKG